MDSRSDSPVGRYATVTAGLRRERRKWLVTGAAGFIGSHLVESLLQLDQDVVGLDNFSSGQAANLARVNGLPGFTMIEGDIRDSTTCKRATRGVQVVLHQAALVSVPKSMEEPSATHDINVTGFLNIIDAARSVGARLVYASSCAVYGNEATLPKREDGETRPLSPYAASKLANEIYADVFHRSYDMSVVGLRYFNVFGPRQDPNGAYAAVIPRWITNLLVGDPCTIFGDGETTRDFVHVSDVVQANVLGALVSNPRAGVYNIASGTRTSLNTLYDVICGAVTEGNSPAAAPTRQPERPGDIRHSQADIARARADLGFEPSRDLAGAIRATVASYTTSDARGRA